MKKLIVICILLFKLTFSFSQDYKILLDSLRKVDTYQALALVDRILFFNKEETNFWQIQKLKLSIKHGDYQAAYNTSIGILNNKQTSIEEKNETLIWIAILFYLQKDFEKALFILEETIFLDKYRSTQCLLVAYTYFRLKDNQKANQYFEYAGIPNAVQDLKKASLSTVRKQNFVFISSCIIPGLGHFFYEDVYAGTTALALHTFLSYNLYVFYLSSPLAATILILPINLRYYIGTIQKIASRGRFEVDTKAKEQLFELLKNKNYL
jgi:tetratricopeptide (TPR) repeat protein